jgi:hypothetical protein
LTALPEPAAGWLEGERRKLSAHALLAARREIYVRRGRRALLMQLLHNGTATADDVRGVVKLPPGIDPKLFGAVPGPLAASGIVRAAGYIKTARPEGHARPVMLWQLADQAGARDWLAAHPDLPDPEPGDLQLNLFDC